MYLPWKIQNPPGALVLLGGFRVSWPMGGCEDGEDSHSSHTKDLNQDEAKAILDAC